jgi:hypothetical protein
MGLGVTWRIAAAAAAGTSHVASGRPCEDSVRAHTLTTRQGDPVLAIFVADGAGSAELGGEGATLAVNAAARSLEQRLADLDAMAPDALIAPIVADVRRDIASACEARDRAARDFACTLLGVVSTHAGTLVMQIGDGGVVLDTGDGLELAIPPMAGEYANATRFVTDADAHEAVAARTFAGPARRVAAFSDGLQRLAIDMATLTPHAPLFARLFGVMESARPAQESELHRALASFLDRPEVNERTDDDKTLALAVLVA